MNCGSKAPCLIIPALVLFLVVGASRSFGQDGFLGKVFGGKKAAESSETPAAPTEPGTSANAFQAVSSDGKVANLAPGTVPPPNRVTPAKPKDGEYKPVPSSALEPHQNSRSPITNGPAPVRPVAKQSAAGRLGPVHEAAYAPVSLDGSVQTAPKTTSVTMAPAAAPVGFNEPVVTNSGKKDWTQQVQSDLPPMPQLFDPSKSASSTPGVAAQKSQSVLPESAVAAAQTPDRRTSNPEMFAANSPAAAEVREIMAQKPESVSKTSPDIIPAPRIAAVAPSQPVGSQPRTMADSSATQGSDSYASASASEPQSDTHPPAQYVGQVTPAEELENASSGMQRFPAIEMPKTKKSIAEENVDWLIDQIATKYADTLGAINNVDVSMDMGTLPDVPSDFGSDWGGGVRKKVWNNQGTVQKTLEGTYASALQYSHQIKAFSEIPLIRETGIQEAQGAFDWTAFVEGRYAHTDEPTSSILDTGAIGRFEQDLWQGEYGMRKRLKSGAEVAVSNRLSTLDNNSQFLQPNPQTGSELVVSITQPLLQGNGYHYNTTSIKIAKLDSKLGAAEYLRQLESYLLEVNRTYWGVYLSRAGYLQRKSLVNRTKSLVSELEDRKGVDAEATASELLRAKSSLAQRQASLIRSEMSIRLAEERLRALVNDPNFALGSTNELVPTTAPILSAPREDVREVAKEAIRNRPELLQGFYQVQAAGLRRDLQKNELLPTLNLILEGTVAGLGESRNLGRAWDDQFENGEGWLAGFTFEVPLERNFAKARSTRREHELRQQLNTLRGTIDSIALEAIVAYRELQTSYRDMQAKYLAATATREELNELEERLDVDAGGKGGTVGYQLQLILDAIDRSQRVEEEFLVSVVVYNTAFTTLDKARGTLLRRNDINIDRSVEDGLDTVTSRIDANGSGQGSESK